MSSIYFGIDIGGTFVKICMYSVDGIERSFVDKWSIPTDTSDHGEHILDDITASIRKACDDNHISFGDVKGIGIGVPGPVTDEGTVLKCVNLGWGVFSIKEKMIELTGLHNIVAANDANVAALGETWMGSGAGYENLVMVTLGTGVGGGLIIGGNIYEGFNGAAAEIGHMTVNKEETLVCGCGNKGCLEQYASATGIVRMANRKLESTETETILRGADIDAKLIFDAARDGDEFAMEIVDTYCDYLGTALSDITKVIAPQVILIGGGVAKAGDILIENVKKYYREHAMHALKHIPIKLASLGNDAGMYGCIRMVIDR